MTDDHLDVDVHDAEVLNEIDMMTNLIIATSASDGPLPQQRIDEILGVPTDDLAGDPGAEGMP
ncbi:MAG: hypothetical protein ACRDQA_01675 [Nocardioidaceae bacterium]